MLQNVDNKGDLTERLF